MADEWRENWTRIRLGDVANLNWGDTSVTKASYVESGFPAYSATGPDGSLPYADYDRAGVVLSAIGAECGRTWLVRGKWSCIKNTIRFWSTHPDVDTEFLYWLTRDPSIWPKRGSAQPFISQGDARNLIIAYPPLPEQRAIAHILGTLDDKIELNRRMNEMLEAVARAIFKSWFVDFDPVRAKAEGRQPFGMNIKTAALFPASFEDSSLGKIPEGWRVASLQELAAIQGGKQLPTEECKPFGTFPVFGANGIMGYAERRTHEEFVIAFGRVGAYCGSVCWTYFGAWINNNASSVVPNRWPEFVLQSMLGSDFGGLRTGSAQPFIPNSSLASLQVVRPPEEVLDTFCSVVRTLRLKEQGSQNESRILAAIRDALLPKLISGEIRLKASE